MSYPPPIYPPVLIDTALELETYQSSIAISEPIIIDNEVLTECSPALPTNDASMSANRSQNVQSDVAWPIVSPLIYRTEVCSMFATRPSRGTYVSLGDTSFRNSTENDRNSPAFAIKISTSVPTSAKNESDSIASAFTIFNPVPIDDSPVPSPPASPHLSSSQSSFSELQNSQDESSFPASVLVNPALSLTPNILEPSPATNLASSSPPNSSPARIFSSSPFASSQSSLLAPTSDEPEKDLTHHQPTSELIDPVQAHTPQFSPRHTAESSPNLPSSSSHESPKYFPSPSLSPKSSPTLVPFEIEIKLESHHDERLDENEDPRSLLKRPRSLIQEESDMETSCSSSTSTSHVPENEEEAPAKRVKLTKTATAPAQKRPTFASQRLQHKKLATPFRSPLMKKTISSENNAPNSPTTDSKPADSPRPPLDLKSMAKPSNQPPTASSTVTPLAPFPANKPKKFTPKAASQFKSPISGPQPAALSSLRLTPNIQALERKVQILKRAVKVKMDGEEEVLEGLVKKWTQAGREVAWEVWGLVKDSGGDGGGASAGWGDAKTRGMKRGFEEGWGWGDKDAKKTKMDDGFERNWGWNVEHAEDQERGERAGCEDDASEMEMKNGMRKSGEYEEEGEEKREDTLGTMLRQLGIAPETFGWNEDEGEFVGE